MTSREPKLLKATHFLRLWCNWYQAEKGRPYPVFKAKHLKLLSLIRKSYSDEELLTFLRMHLFETNDFVRKAGHPLELLGSQIPRYIQVQAEKARSLQTAVVSTGEYERRKASLASA